MAALATIIETQQRVFEWAGMPASWMRFVGVVALGGLCALVVWLYRAERRSGAGRAVRVLLAALRCGAFVGVAAIWLEPVVATYIFRSVSARVAVLVDTSASMSVADADEPTPAGAPPVSRLERIRRWLGENDHAWLRRLAERNELRVYAFGEKTAHVALPWEGGSATASRHAQLEFSGLEALSPVQGHTDLGEALSAVFSDIGDSPVAGVVLLTDGNVNRGLGPDELATLARQFKAPVYAVGVGHPAEPPNVRITNLAAPSTVPPGDPFGVRLEVVASGIEPTDAEVALTVQPAAGGTALEQSHTAVATRRVRLAESDSPAVVEFEVAPPAPGEYTYRAHVAPLAGETITADNTRDTVVLVLEERLRVLVVAGGPSYEYQYLTRLLERDQTIDLSCWLQSADERAVRDGDVPLTRLPREPADVFLYDAVLLLDPDPTELDASWAVTLRRWVDELGGGVLLQAGPHYTSRWLRDPRLQELVSILPITPDPDADMRVQAWGTYRPDPLALHVPDAALGHPLVALHADAAANRDVWAALPGVWWYLPVLRAKPVAAVLLEQDSPAHRNQYGPAVLLAVQTVGAGRAAYLGFNGTWRWRATAEPYFNRFWVQLVRYLAHARRQETSKRGTIVLDREAFTVGDYVKIEARVLDQAFAPLHEPTVRAELVWSSGPAQECVLSAIPGRDGWFAGRVLLEREGPTVVRVPLPGPVGVQPPASQSPASSQPSEQLTKRIRVQRSDVELRALRLREDVLMTLAEQTGGAYCRLAEAGDLPEQIRAARQRKPPQRAAAEPLWDRGWVLAGLASLLAVEWTIRRRNHLL